jgi:hypothetical protein
MDWLGEMMIESASLLPGRGSANGSKTSDEIPLEHRPPAAIRQRRVLINGKSQKLGRSLPDRNSLLIKASLSSSGPCDRKTRKKPAGLDLRDRCSCFASGLVFPGGVTYL